MSYKKFCIVDGIQYSAVDGEHGSCQNCAAEHNKSLCDQLPNCINFPLEDEFDIIWVKVNKENKK